MGDSNNECNSASVKFLQWAMSVKGAVASRSVLAEPLGIDDVALNALVEAGVIAEKLR